MATYTTTSLLTADLSVEFFDKDTTISIITDTVDEINEALSVKLSAKTDEEDVITIINQRVQEAISGTSGGGDDDIAGNYAYRSYGGTGTQTFGYSYDFDQEQMVVDYYDNTGDDVFTIIKAGHADLVKDFFVALKNNETEIQGTIDLSVMPNTYKTFDEYLATKTTEEIQQIVSALNDSKILVGKAVDVNEDTEERKITYYLSSNNPTSFTCTNYYATSAAIEMLNVSLQIGSGGQSLDEFENITDADKTWFASSGQWLIDNFLSSNIDLLSSAYYSNQLLMDDYGMSIPSVPACGAFDLKTKQFLESEYDIYEEGVIGLLIRFDGSSGSLIADGESPFKHHYSNINDAGSRYAINFSTSIYPTSESPIVPLSALTLVSSGADDGDSLPIWRENLGTIIGEQRARVQFFESSVIQTSIGGGLPTDNALTAFATKTSIASIVDKVNALDGIHESLSSITALPTDGSIANIDIINKVNDLIAALQK